MSSYTLEAVKAALKQRSIAFQVVEHSDSASLEAWEANVRSVVAHSELLFAKTMLLKPKGGSVTTPILYVTTTTSGVNPAQAAKQVGNKEARAAADDLVAATLPCVTNKLDLTPFALECVPADRLNETLRVAVFDALLDATSTAKIAFRAFAGDASFVMDAHEFAKWAGHFDIASITVPTATPTASASKNAVAAAANESAEDDKVIIGLTAKKETDFKNWYRQLLIKAEMLEYYDVSGCYVLRPNSYSIWEYIQQHFDAGIKKLGVRNCYFPMFVTEDMLQKEKDHIEGFAPEVAWVTKAGQSNLDKPVAIRPTSETVMYPTYAKWIKSWRDLPLRLNQWCNVVRWEFKNPLPFIRTREFLWQEGHTAFATKAEADVEVRHILQLYADVYEQLLAVPMMQGIKSHKEKFAGGLYTTTIEGFVPSTGRGIQAGTSHCLGQNFANMFDITFLDDQHQSQKVWQNSWGLSTRTLGVLCMIHGDNKGLVLPPRVAHTQVVVMPVGITARTTEQERLALTKAATDLVAILNAAGVRATDDCRTQVTPGYKFNHWELRGIPIRLEIGPRDLAKKETRAVRRDTGEACNLSVAEIVVSTQKLLDTMQSEMLARATAERDSRIREIMLFENGFVEALNAKCMVVSPWCNREACEDWVKDNSARQDDGSDAPIDEKEPSMGAKTLCLPFAYNEDPSRKFKEGTKCFACDKPADLWALWGRSY